ncbi:hypothetical protein LTS10_012515 [Elasticomyces elasticus]|nr:hypothetical protein LTS10_012515 [Elasticomyces elasticus]
MAKAFDQDIKLSDTAVAEDVELRNVDTSHIAPKYQGTDGDKVHMTTLGRDQETRRMFTFISMLGFGSTLMYVTSPRSPLHVVLDIIVSQLRILAATSAGQYHWVSEFAPPSVEKYLSYITGWLCIAGWQGGITGIGMLVATIIQGLITLNDVNYVAQGWHGTLLTIGIVAFCVLFNTYGARQLPVVEGSLAILHFGGMFVIIIILWYALDPRECSS